MTTKMRQKVVFFLRHYNDIDHVVPVIWKWMSMTGIPSVVIISNTPEILSDFRIQSLQKLDNLEIHLVDDFIPPVIPPESSQYNNYTWSIRIIYKLFRRIMRFMPSRLENIMRRLYSPVSVIGRKAGANERSSDIAKRILDETMSDIDQSLIVFDWISDNMTAYIDFATPICEAAHARGFKTVSLPHGDEPHYCKMIRRDELNYEVTNIYKAARNLFDFIVVPNELCAKRYRGYCDDQQVKVLGSPRYNDEWVAKIHEMVAPHQIHGTDDKLKIVFYLRTFSYPLFWDEIVRTISMITQFHKVHLVVMHHTRGILLDQLVSRYPELAPRQEGNLDVLAGDIHSTALIRWADVVLDVGTSAVFEAVKLNKPILELEYLHATYTTISHYMPDCVMMCRDHLYDAIQSFISNGFENFYNLEEKARFIREVIDVPDGEVLPRYVEFLQHALGKEA